MESWVYISNIINKNNQLMIFEGWELDEISSLKCWGSNLPYLSARCNNVHYFKKTNYIAQGKWGTWSISECWINHKMLTSDINNKQFFKMLICSSEYVTSLFQRKTNKWNYHDRDNARSFSYEDVGILRFFIDDGGLFSFDQETLLIMLVTPRMFESWSVQTSRETKHVKIYLLSNYEYTYFTSNGINHLLFFRSKLLAVNYKL